jgi:AP-1 complex subunit sigma 1/2
MINFLLLVSRQGKTRLTKWYESYAAKEKARIVREITSTCLARSPKMCNFVEWRNKKIIYKRYASLFFIVCVDAEDNELITLEMIHLYVEVLDRYFGNVCELDIIFNFHKAYYILDEIFVGGELCESSKKEVLSVCAQMDEMMEEREDGAKTGFEGSAGRVRK